MKCMLSLKLLLGLFCFSSIDVQAGITGTLPSQSFLYCDCANQVSFEYRVRADNLLKLQVKRNVVTVYFDEYSHPRVNAFMKPYFARPDRYQFLARSDLDHLGLHTCASEVEIDHVHISHMKLGKIDAGRFEKILDSLVANDLIEAEVAEIVKERFKRSRYALLAASELNISQNSSSHSRLNAYTMVGSCFWDCLSVLFRS